LERTGRHGKVVRGGGSRGVCMRREGEDKGAKMRDTGVEVIWVGADSAEQRVEKDSALSL
jgi:hypothetical protein